MVTLSSLMPPDLDPILRLHLVNDTIPLVSVRCQNQYTHLFTQCQFDSPLRHWISDFPEERKLQAVDIFPFKAAGRSSAMIIKAHLTVS